MVREERMNLIQKIEEERNSRLLIYITGDRKGLETKISADAYPFFLNHLLRIGKQKRIDLFLYSTGGITIAGYGLVNLIREFCDSFSVIIPFKAFSAATLAALGADEILMTKMAQLSPIDPSSYSPLNPKIPVSNQPDAYTIVPLHVEDVVNYISFARELLDLQDEESLVRIFEKLTDEVHPLVLGNISRVREQIGFLAKTLLSYHMKDEKKIEEIVETLVRGRYTHEYLIGRKEAKEVIGLSVTEISDSLEKTIANLFAEYDNLLQLSAPYHPESVLGESEDEIGRGLFNRAIVEAKDETFVYRTEKEVRRIQLQPPQVPAPTIGYIERIISEQWVEDNNI